MQRVRLEISTMIDFNVYRVLEKIMELYRDAEDMEEQTTYRKAFDAFIDVLAEDGVITDNEVTFLELWLVTK